MASSYKHNRAAFRVEVLKSEFMAAEMLERAEIVQGAAETIAPVYYQGPHPGRYRDSFRASTRQRKNRVVGVVSNSAPEALAVEFGTQNNEAHHTMVRALSIIEGSGGSSSTGLGGGE